jgi:hypothetical protein
MRKGLIVALTLALIGPALGAQPKLEAIAELGFLGFFSHTVQFGRDGTTFDYVDDGGQNVLFPFSRVSAEIVFAPRHRVILLIQPIDIRTEVRLESETIVDGAPFAAGTPMDLRYGFDFYRVSYLYDFDVRPEVELAAGVSFQIRDADIIFAAKDGSDLRRNGGLGPVPILKFRYRRPIGGPYWAAAELDGFYASGRYITGSGNDFVGAILDASLRAGLTVRENIDVFLNLRYLGGGARGDDEDDTGPGDGYTENWLNAYSLSLGARLH